MNEYCDRLGCENHENLTSFEMNGDRVRRICESCLEEMEEKYEERYLEWSAEVNIGKFLRKKKKVPTPRYTVREYIEIACKPTSTNE